MAGGQSSRMGGGDKPLIKLGDETVLSRIHRLIAPQLDHIIINANGDGARFNDFGLPVIADVLPGHPGPLAGILTAMDWAATHCPQVSHILSLPGDAPFMPKDLLNKLDEALKDHQADIVCARSGSQVHPIVALWSCDLRDQLHHALVVEDLHKIRAWTARFKLIEVSWSCEPYDPFFNMNSPEDVVEAEQIRLKHSL